MNGSEQEDNKNRGFSINYRQIKCWEIEIYDCMLWRRFNWLMMYLFDSRLRDHRQERKQWTIAKSDGTVSPHSVALLQQTVWSKVLVLSCSVFVKFDLNLIPSLVASYIVTTFNKVTDEQNEDDPNRPPLNNVSCVFPCLCREQSCLPPQLRPSSTTTRHSCQSRQ